VAKVCRAARPLIVIAPEIALAAVAAASALFTQMIGAGVLGAMKANFGGRLFANGALESGGLSHVSSLCYFAFDDCGAAGLGVAGAAAAGL
jgi:hypothetical protein